MYPLIFICFLVIWLIKLLYFYKKIFLNFNENDKQKVIEKKKKVEKGGLYQKIFPISYIIQADECVHLENIKLPLLKNQMYVSGLSR